MHRGHIALAEYVVGQGLATEAVLVVSPQSPYKQAAELAPEIDRFEMAEIACAASKYPERIKPSVVEFLLPKPSYTIDTLRYLKENFGSGMQFSILMGSDQIARLAGWKEYEQILEYPVYVYPRRGEPAEGFEGRITPLTDAPLQDFASTDVRDRIGRGEDVAAMLDEGVAAYIRRKGLWSPATRIAALGAQIAAEPREHGAPGRARKTPLPDGRVGSGPQRLQRGAAYRRHARRSQGVRPDGAGDTGIPIQRYIQPLK